ncbi:MAG: riboflavin synthase [Flavobacteriaceae bacterium]|nr:MAG: riboflavin synthase [Flavobacteriales bacterium]
MFTGIIENLAKIISIKKSKGNLDITLSSSLTSEFKIDQSISHNGICLTITNIDGNNYTVTAIEETINKTTINSWKKGDSVNLERAMKLGDRLDGHMIQGHVDQIGTCVDFTMKDGSWEYVIQYEKSENITVEKGSIAVNGVSLTVIDSKTNSFKVAIIPYTYEHTSFKTLRKGDLINLEFDILGKYLYKMSKNYLS